MRDLSLHILDLMENSIRASASIISVTLSADGQKDVLRIIVEDNGCGLSVPPSMAVDPFYTTKSGKRVGLGLSFFQAATERAGGKLSMRRSELGGLTIEAVMRLTHIDRSPLGDVAAAVSSVVCTNPGLDVWCRLHVDGRECVVRVSDVAKELPAGERCGLSVARRVAGKVRKGLASIAMNS